MFSAARMSVELIVIGIIVAIDPSTSRRVPEGRRVRHASDLLCWLRLAGRQPCIWVARDLLGIEPA